MGMGVAVQGMLGSMPCPADLRRADVDGEVVISVGAQVLFRYAAGDGGLRNVAAVTLPELGFTGRAVGEVLGITEEYVSMLRARVRREGSRALMRRQGRPPALGQRQLATARGMRAQGAPDTAIAARLGVHAATVVRALGRRSVPPAAPAAPVVVQGELVPVEAGPGEGEHAEQAQEGASAAAGPVGEAGGTPVAGVPGSARIGTGSYPCRYAGAMLAHSYLDRVGAQTIFATVTGAPGRAYDDTAVLTTATLGFALGAGSVEGIKHLARAQAGPTVGLRAIPELATFRSRLAALADGTDPLATQRAFAAGMLAADPAADPVYFVDDHFVPYAGARPVGKGWNTKRRHAQPGREDTVVVDARGRAVVFDTGQPSGLAATLPGALAQLREVIGPAAPVLLGFDRGGAYPVVFTACRAAGAHWVTYRRAPLVPTTATPTRSTTVRDGKQVVVTLADEPVQLKGYGAARQLTLFEAGAPVLQVLTSDTTGTGADLLCWLRARWRIENMFKYAAQHNGIDSLACYDMDTTPDTAMVANPARIAARAAVADAQSELVAAERALPQLLNGDGTPKQMNAALPGVHQRIREATTAVAAAKTALRPVPAKVPATDLDPGATRARPHLARRGLQMVLRLLAFNAEAWLAEHLNAYLADPDEYRAITRHLLHSGGHVTYTDTDITITLDRPDTPRVARALTLLVDELNTTPPRLPGDPRHLTYQITGAQVSTTTADQLEEV